MTKLENIGNWVLIRTALLAGTAVFLHWNNTALQISEHTVASDRLPNSFDGFKIVHISDLHNTAFRDLPEKITALSPDIIVVTGDIVHDAPKDKALQFAREAVEIAPTYYVCGNHENRMDYDTLFAELRQIGVTVLRNESVTLEKEGQSICLAGIDDPTFDLDSSVADRLQPLMQEDSYTILLSHRPELFEEYVALGVDLAFTGHAHGGQFRLPFIGGLYVPNQGVLPKYDAGMFTCGATHMLISRGLGNSAFPFRLFNRPEIVAVTLKSEK